MIGFSGAARALGRPGSGYEERNFHGRRERALMKVKTLRPAASKWGWGLVLAVAVLLVVNGVTLYVFITETPQERIIAVLVTGLGLQALPAAVTGFRHGTRWAWNATWALFVVLLAVAGQALVGEGEAPEIGIWYLFLAIVVVAGQLLAAKGLVRSA
jgi:hypothetical protein